MDDLDALLDDAAQPGEATFTLDPRRAREQLANHALQDPYTYVLKLVQWAVTSGARNIDVTLAGNRLEFRHDGEQPEPLGPEAHLHKGNFDLALALATLDRLHAQPSYGEGLIIEGVPQSVRMLDLLTVKLNAGWWQRLKTWLRPEAALLRLRCVYCPAALTLNGELVNRPWPASRPEWTPDGWEVWPERSPNIFAGLRCVGPGPLLNPRVMPVQPGREDQGCEAFFYPVATYEWKYGASQLTWVRHGVSLGVERGTLSNYICAVASADDLTVDLSQFSVVKDARYQEKMQRLHAATLNP